MPSIYGYFDDDSNIPAYDPGLEIDCPICGQPLCDPMKSPSFMVPGDSRSYFYRIHKGCANEQAMSEIEGVIVDAIFHARETN